jgi:hypothetical protein
MRNAFVLFVFSVVGASLAVSLNACSAKRSGVASSSRSGAKSTGISSPIVSPLEVRIDNPTRLTSISSLGILPPVLSTSVSDQSITTVGLQELIQRRADEILGMKVLKVEGSGHGNVGKGRADSVLKTELLTFRERQGSSVGGEPATVAFTMSIERVSDGQEVWQAKYFFRQEALSENWLKLGQRFGSDGTGAGWITGHEVLDRGLSAALRDLANRRDQQFAGAQ